MVEYFNSRQQIVNNGDYVVNKVKYLEDEK